MTPQKINAYVMERLGESISINASQLPLAGAEDFVKLIYVRLYGQRKNMDYRIELAEKTEVNGYEFKDFVISKKEW